MVYDMKWTPMVAGLVTIRVEIFSKYDRVPINSYDVELVDILTLPDLRVELNSFMVDSPIPVTINTSVDVFLTIENVGELPAGDFMVRLYDSEKKPENMIGNEVLVNGLDPEGKEEVSFAWSTGLPIGYHDLIVVIDEIGSVKEQDETNNEVIYQVMVDTPPDLTFTTDIGGSPGVVTEGKNGYVCLRRDEERTALDRLARRILPRPEVLRTRLADLDSFPSPREDPAGRRPPPPFVTSSGPRLGSP